MGLVIENKTKQINREYESTKKLIIKCYNRADELKVQGANKSTIKSLKLLAKLAKKKLRNLKYEKLRMAIEGN